MKLHRLELEGFGPFRDRQVVDFDAFDDDGIFLIAGRTGAGKSSILDGVCFALYGGAPRYEGVEKRLRSDHCAPDDPTEVRLELTAGGSRWRVTRAPEHERPKARGEGLTTVPHAARLEEQVGEDWIGRAAKPRDVALLLDEILGLSQQQFLQVILLAQNRFAQFLLARNDDRQSLLRTLFGTRTYSDYQEELDGRRRAAAERLAGGRARLEGVLDEAERQIAEHDLGGAEERAEALADAAVRVDALGRAVQRAAYRVEGLDRERDEAEAAHVAAERAHSVLVALREKQERRDASRTALAALEDRSGEIADRRTRLAAASAAELLRDPIARADRAAQALGAAEREEAIASAGWLAAGEAPATAEGLALRIERMTGDLALWQAAAAHERALGEHLERRAIAERTASDLSEQLAAVQARAGEYPALLAELDGELREQVSLAAPLDSARTSLAAAESRLEAAREAERLWEIRRTAEQAYAEASARSAAAAAAVAALLQRRLAGYAGELAAALVDGEPCAVCGSSSHPDPAHPSDEPVTDAMLEAAEAEKTAATDAERIASDSAREAREAHAAVAARAGGEPVERLTALVAAEREKVAAAEEARTHRDRLAGDRATLLAAQAADAEGQDELARRLADARRDADAAAAQASAARAAVDAARGDFETVAVRIADTTGLRDLARALVEAMRERAARAEESAAAADERDARIARSDFPDIAAATAALLPAGERDALAARIREHEVAHAAEVERLRDLELELAGVPEDPVDLGASLSEVARARERWVAAVDRAVRAERAATALRELHRRAAAAHEGIAELSAEHATIAALADAVAGRNARKMDLETFVLAAELEEIVTAANLRLDDMSAGRYQLRHTDALTGRGAAGLGLEVVDAYTGQARPPQSLSGGETFLASLALALGLAQVVTQRAGGIRLDTLFIDEGFGSLDSDTLELAMRTLDELRQGGRTVGVISHVEAMKEQLPAQLVVSATPEGSSVVRQDSGALV